ncbi:c-type cytochrome [Psychrobacter ciconiae]|uniref:c-type cytochrome n=1 Tax=Psychrobacter ciconiae TaxID=1553449 RepID=UPI00191AD9B5|nr:c-type cytochrome [Psychrobacter ciconiae]
MRPNFLKLNHPASWLAQGAVVLLLNSPLVIPQSTAADVAKVYQSSCAACHDHSVFNAPKKGDKVTWDKLKQQKGMPALINSVKGGMTQMPAGGLCENCNEKDFKALIEFMSK